MSKYWDSSGIAGGLDDLILLIDGWRDGFRYVGRLSAELIDVRAWEFRVVLWVWFTDCEGNFLFKVHRFHFFIISPRTSPFRKQNNTATISPCNKCNWVLRTNCRAILDDHWSYYHCYHTHTGPGVKNAEHFNHLHIVGLVPYPKSLRSKDLNTQLTVPVGHIFDR